MMTVMGDACMGISSDAGSIPAWSTKKDCCKAVFFCTSGSRTRRERAQLAEANGPVNRLRRRGLKGGYAAGGIPAWSNRVGGEIDISPTSHTTVRTVRYTAVQST